MSSRTLSIFLMVAALPLGCLNPPEPLTEFPDIPMFPGSELQMRQPKDTTEPAKICMYRVHGMKWLDVQKFYERYMPKFGWEVAEPAESFARDPHLYYAKGDEMVAINARSYAPREQFAVFRYKRSDSMPTLGES